MRKPQTPQVYVSTGASPRRWRRRVLLGLLVVVGLAIIAGVAMLVHLQQLWLHPFQQAASLLGPPFGGKQRVYTDVEAEFNTRKSMSEMFEIAPRSATAQAFLTLSRTPRFSRSDAMRIR